MNERKSLLHHLVEAYERYRAERQIVHQMERPPTQPRWQHRLTRHLVPNIGTILVVIALLWAQSAGALPLGQGASSPLQSSSITLAYQGRLADSAGPPLTGTYNMIFRLYDVPTGGAPLWEEQWTGSNGVRVSDGLFNVMLGSLEPIPAGVIAGREQLWLGITVGTDDEMQPRVQLGSVPWAVQALTVPDGSITTEKIADGAVTSLKLSRRITRIVATTDVPMPNPHTWYDALSLTINLEREMIVTIHASIGVQNNSTAAFFAAAVFVDGNSVISSHRWNNQPGIGEQLMMSTSLLLGPGQHEIKLRATSWRNNGFVNGDDRTQLIVVEG